MDEPNFLHLDPLVKGLVSLRTKLEKTKLLPQNYENNLEVQSLTRRIEKLLKSPEIKPKLVSSNERLKYEGDYSTAYNADYVCNVCDSVEGISPDQQRHHLNLFTYDMISGIMTCTVCKSTNVTCHFSVQNS